MWRMSSSYKHSKVLECAGGRNVDGDGAIKWVRLAAGRCIGESDLLAIANDETQMSDVQNWGNNRCTHGFGPGNDSGPPVLKKRTSIQPRPSNAVCPHGSVPRS